MSLDSLDTVADLSNSWRSVKSSRTSVIMYINNLTALANIVEGLPEFAQKSSQADTDFLSALKTWVTSCVNSCPNPPTQE